VGVSATFANVIVVAVSPTIVKTPGMPTLVITAFSPLPTICVPVMVTCMPSLKPAVRKLQLAQVSVLVGSAGSVAPVTVMFMLPVTCERFGSAT
jgi:hypothetical protein